jgi:hypothetical protein
MLETQLSKWASAAHRTRAKKQSPANNSAARRDMIAQACSCAMLKSQNTNPGINKSVNDSSPVITATIVKS